MEFLNTWAVGLSFIMTGIMFKRSYPEKISDRKGYRTKRSKTSQEAWVFANELASNMYIIGGVLAIIAANLVSIYITKELYPLLFVALLIGFICQMSTEFILKVTFDKAGRRKRK